MLCCALQTYTPYNDKVPEAHTEEVVGIDVSQPAMKERLQRVSFTQLLKLNKPDWILVLVGVVCSAVFGCLFPLMATFFGDVLGVYIISKQAYYHNEFYM